MASRWKRLSIEKKWLRMAVRWLTDEVVVLQGFYKGWRESKNAS